MACLRRDLLGEQWLTRWLTQATENRAFSGACLPYYYFPGKPWLRRYVGAASCALNLHQHRRPQVSKRKTSVPCLCEGAGQRACTVPTSTLTTVIRVKLSIPILSDGKGNGNPTQVHQRNGALIPIPSKGMGLPAPVC